jgi:hypothetical protein
MTPPERYVKAKGPGPVTMVLSVLLAAAVVIVAIVLWPEGPDPCGEGLHTSGDECIGVTDGSKVFMPALAEVTRRIKEENRRIEDQPHATIALMIPMTSDHPEVRKQILHEVQGAYIAQYYANGADEDEKKDGEHPKIRLVLANPGKKRDQWKPVAGQLAAMARSGKDKLRTVFGFDLSVNDTKDAIEYLTKAEGIPVVSGPVTGDEFANPEPGDGSLAEPKFPWYARIAPTNSDQADALVNFDKQLDLQRAILVQDTREDPYNSSLLQAFTRKLDRSPHEPMSFRSDGPDAEGHLSSEFGRMATDICVLTPEVNTVYFAGRPTHLRQFLNELAWNRPCKDRPFKVVSGSGASTLYADRKLRWDALSGRGTHGRRWRAVTVEYTSISHPEGWTSHSPPDTGGSPEAITTLRDRLQSTERPVGPFGPTDIYDSRTVSVHDAALTAIRGIRIHAEGRGEDYIPSLREIGKDWDSLRGVHKVDGASGWICIDNVGNAYNKAVAVIQLDPTEPLRRPKLLGLAWPAGKPPPKDNRETGACQIPRRR